MHFNRPWICAAALLIGSCADRKPVVHPHFPDGGLLKGARPLPQGVLDSLSGMFVASGEETAIGGRTVVHPAPGTLSFFTSVNDGYAVTQGGCIDGGARVVFEGYWRHAATDDSGLFRVFLEDPQLVRAACAKPPLPLAPTLVSFSGAWSNGEAEPDQPVRFDYMRPLVDPGEHFMVTAHHGACRTIDDCGASENSVESIRMVESFGASAVEIDVRTTSDGVPILYHDDNFTPRLSRGTYCHGPVSDFTFAHVETLCTLLFGEKVPTLDHALAVAVEETTLRAVWLDIKVPEAIAPVLPIVAKYNALAKKKRRKFEAVVGMGDSSIIDAYVAASPPPGTPCLVELELDDVRRANCHLWGPRWTRGPMADDVVTMQSEGRAVVYWTIDEREFIDLFLTTGKPNGMLSDRTGTVLERFNEVGTVPRGSAVNP